MEMLHISAKKLREFNTTQCKLIKYKFHLSKYAHHSHLMSHMRIRTFEHIYYRAKINFLHQIRQSPVIQELFNYLMNDPLYKASINSYVHQIKTLSNKFNVDTGKSKEEMLAMIDQAFSIPEDERGSRIGQVLEAINAAIWKKEYDIADRAHTELKELVYIFEDSISEDNSIDSDTVYALEESTLEGDTMNIFDESTSGENTTIDSYNSSEEETNGTTD